MKADRWLAVRPQGFPVVGCFSLIADVFRGDCNVVVRAFFHDLARHFAAHVADLALQVPHTGFPRI